MNYKLYYSVCTEREGSWQRPDGVIISDDIELLKAKISSLPKYDADLSWEYSEIKSIEITDEKFEWYCKKAIEGILYIDNLESIR